MSTTTIESVNSSVQHGSSEQSKHTGPLVAELAKFFCEVFETHPGLQGLPRLHGVICRAKERSETNSGEEYYGEGEGPSNSPSVVQIQQSFLFTDAASLSIVGYHRGSLSFEHLHWLHICPNYLNSDCKCTASTTIKRMGFQILWIPYAGHKKAENYLASVVAFLCRYDRGKFNLFVNGQATDLPAHIHDQIESFVVWIGKRSASDMEADTKCKSIFASRKRSREDAGLDAQENNDIADEVRHESPERRLSERPFSNLRFTKEVQGHMEGEIRRLILTHFPEHGDLSYIQDFKTLVKSYYFLDAPKIDRFADQVLTSVFQTWSAYSLTDILNIRKESEYDSEKYYSLSLSTHIVKRLLLNQLQIPEEVLTFVWNTVDIVNRALPQRNALLIRGEPGAGKTFFISTLTDLVWSVAWLHSGLTRSSFNYLRGQRLGVINQFECKPSQAAKVRDLIDGKIGARTVTPRIPLLLTTNHDYLRSLKPADRQALHERVFEYVWHPQPWLELLNKQIHPLVWIVLADLKAGDAHVFHNVMGTEQIVALAEREHVNEDKAQRHRETSLYLRNCFEEMVRHEELSLRADGNEPSPVEPMAC